VLLRERPAPVPLDMDAVSPASREDTFPVALMAVLLTFIALMFCYFHGYILMYGDAVAHLAIARRILDSRNPGLSQLGGVWLPLPHLLMVPLAQKMEWWQNGLAGAWPSMLCYIASVAGVYRLARRMMTPRWSFVATAFYGLNPNLLYLSTTAMTEPLFLAELVWITLITMEGVDAIRAGRTSTASRRLLLAGVLILAAVYTRYDGWILGAAAWCVLAWTLWRHWETGRKIVPSFVTFTMLTVAGPLSWLWYNQHFMHDPLDFIRGPYSAAAIEKKTSPPGSKHYRGWHNPGWALLFYTRTAQVDAAWWETGFVMLAVALGGLIAAVRKRVALSSLLLWMPLPFYVYSVAYGSVPIFIPQLYPHSFYNSRYGMEMLPALAIFFALALGLAYGRLKESQPLAARFFSPVMLALAALNSIGMMYHTPLVLKEAMVNSTTRMAFERSLAEQLRAMPPGVPILMSIDDHVGALQVAGISLHQTLNDSDYDSWTAALKAPADHAAVVIAMAGDPVSKAVAEHPEGLTEMTVLCTTGQPCARIYKSNRFGFSSSTTHR
jgi:Dolichyl-phosphate-mannose-protein mannosyltransferase